MSDDFYIGYRKTAPANIARFVRAAAIAIAVVVVATAAAIGAMQASPAKSFYDFGGTTRFEATLVPNPVPIAVIHSEQGRPVEEYSALLVTQGKHGLGVDRNADPRQVQFTGAKESRDGAYMIEISDPHAMKQGPNANAPVPSARSEWSGEGELIDTKCFLGVMNPASGKVHRGCAALCLRGGVPAGLAIAQSDGNTKVIILNFRGDGTPRLNPEWAGRVVRARGTLENLLGLPVLEVKDIALR